MLSNLKRENLTFITYRSMTSTNLEQSFTARRETALETPQRNVHGPTLIISYR